jgi:hypothetical protein
MAQTTVPETGNNEMTNLQARNFIKSRLEDFGAKDALHDVVDQNLKNNVAEFRGTARITLRDKPDVLEAEFRFVKLNEGRYYIDGYEAKRTGQGIDERKQYFGAYNSRGYHLEQANQLLRGGSLLNKIRNKDGEEIERFTRLDFTSMTPTGNYVQKHTYVNDIPDFNPTILLGRVDVVGSPAKKEQMLVDLAKGEAVTVTRTNGEKGHIELSPKDKAINFYDEKGKMTPFSDEKVQVQKVDTKGRVAKAAKVASPQPTRTKKHGVKRA